MIIHPIISWGSYYSRCLFELHVLEIARINKWFYSELFISIKSIYKYIKAMKPFPWDHSTHKAVFDYYSWSVITRISFWSNGVKFTTVTMQSTERMPARSWINDIDIINNYIHTSYEWGNKIWSREQI